MNSSFMLYSNYTIPAYDQNTCICSQEENRTATFKERVVYKRQDFNGSLNYAPTKTRTQDSQAESQARPIETVNAIAIEKPGKDGVQKGPKGGG